MKADRRHARRRHRALRAVGSKVVVAAAITGLKPNSEHGFHVHEKGDCSAPDATSAGGHFNPAGRPHGHHGKRNAMPGTCPTCAPMPPATAAGDVGDRPAVRRQRVGRRDRPQRGDPSRPGRLRQPAGWQTPSAPVLRLDRRREIGGKRSAARRQAASPCARGQQARGHQGTRGRGRRGSRSRLALTKGKPASTSSRQRAVVSSPLRGSSYSGANRASARSRCAPAASSARSRRRRSPVPWSAASACRAAPGGRRARPRARGPKARK